MLTCRANIVQLESGAFTVQSMPSAPMYTIEYKIQHGMKLATKQFQDQLRQPIRDGASKYEKVMYKCFYVAKRRLFSSLVSDIGENTKHEFNNLLQLDDALPPSLRKETDKIRTIQANDSTTTTTMPSFHLLQRFLLNGTHSWLPSTYLNPYVT
jgi:hypothetical protein